MKKNGNFWAGLDEVCTGRAVLSVWQDWFGADFEKVKPYLRPTEELTGFHPCQRVPPCDCTHEVREGYEEGWIAVCACGDGDCDAFEVQAQDLMIHALERGRVGTAAGRALGLLASQPRRQTLEEGTVEVGIYGPLQAPAYLCLPGSAPVLLREVERLIGERPGPFLLLTPTRRCFTPEADGALERAGCTALALSEVLEVVGPGEIGCGISRGEGSVGIEQGAGGLFRLKAPVEPVLAEWTDRVARLRGDRAGTLKRIHHEIAAVRKDFRDLHVAKERLEQMLGEGLFAFTRKVDAKSFRVLCAILAEGDVAKASRALELGDSTVRDLLREWGKGDKAHRAMLDLVRWRKKVGGKSTVPLNEAVLHEKATTADYPGLLADVLDGLVSMTEEDWQERCEELADLLRPHVER